MRPFRQNRVSLLPLIAVILLAVNFPIGAKASTPDESRCATSLCRYQSIQDVLRTNPADPTARLKLAEYYSNRGQFATALEIIRKLQKEGLQSTELRVIDAEVKLASGAKAEAFREFDGLAKERLLPPIQLRVARGLESLGFKDRALTLVATAAGGDENSWNYLLRLGTELHDGPAVERARAALNRFAGESRISDQSADGLEDEILMRKSDLTLGEIPTRTRLLADTLVDNFGKEGLLSQRVQQWIQIGRNEALSAAAIRTIKYSPQTQVIDVLDARLHKGNGSMIEGRRLPDEAAPDTTAQMYYGLRNIRYQFPSAEPGDVIELDYRIVPKPGELLSGVGEIVSFGVSMPTDVKRYTLVARDGAKPRVAFERVGSPVSRVVDNAQVTTWEVRDLHPTSSEPRSPAAAELAGYVSVSPFADWEQLGSWYGQKVGTQFELTPELKKIVKGLMAGKSSDVDRISAIQQFVLRNTHYVALEFGEYSYKPYRVADVYARKFGDCKDKASLMIAMLREAGIDAELALIRTQKLGAIVSDTAVLAAFNHAIVYIPRYEIWVDATADYAALNELPVEDQGAMALTVALDGTAALRKVPETSSDDNTTQRRIVADVRRDGSVTFRANQYTRGEDAPSLRRELESPDRQRDSLQRGLAEMVPAVRVNDVQVSRGERERVDIDFGGEVNSYRGKKEVTVNSTWYARRYVKTLAPLLTRTQDLVINAPWKTEEEVRVNLPAGAMVRTRPPEFVRNTQFGTATIRYDVGDGVLIMRSSVEIKKGRVAPGRYAAFRQFCTDLDNAFREQVSITIP